MRDTQTLIALSTENNDVHGNSESELGSTPPNSVGLITHQGSQLGSSNSSVHANNIDLSVTVDQNVNGQNLGEGENVLDFAEWYSLGDEDSDGSRTFYTPASDAYCMFYEFISKMHKH